MDAFRLAAEMRYSQLNKIKTTKDIKICKVENLPKKNIPKGKLRSLLPDDTHLDTGICVMMHTTEGTVLEVRGYDENAEPFSYKFHLDKSPKQPISMRAVGASGEVAKLLISTESKTAKIHQL